MSVSKKRKVRVLDPAHSPKAKFYPKPVRGPSSKAAAPLGTKGKIGKDPAIPPKDDEQDHPSLPKTFMIIAGSYEKLLYGLEATLVDVAEPGSSARQLQLKPIFIFPAHVSCVKAVAASPTGGKWLATGSADEIIKVWDLRRRKEIGGLIHHEGSITYLTFPSRSHLLSASEDGTLCLFRARDWAVLRVLKGHKGRVNCVAVHPSGKLALSVGKDRTLRMWDLMRGKGSASTKLGKEGEVVCWSPSGQRFAVQSGTSIELFSTNMTLLHTLTHPSRVHDVKFFRPVNVDGQPEFLLVAAEDKKVTVYQLLSTADAPPRVIAELVGHTNRVKAIDIISIAIPPYTDLKSATYASTVSSDGLIRIFDLGDVLRALRAHPTEQPVVVESVTEYDTKGSRLTCVAMGDGELVADTQRVGKRKRDDEADDMADDWPSEVEEEEGSAEGDGEVDKSDDSEQESE
ncbi:WD40-repeat-containing domain protein [Gautieria morchelliformis]|nr:WD40-repeat-containing domain protein [Gautieria morchelliformis]